MLPKTAPVTTNLCDRRAVPLVRGAWAYLLASWSFHIHMAYALGM
jgi:hypothetical protein